MSEQSVPQTRRLNLLVGSSAFANLGDGIAKVAFPLLAVQVTQDPLLIAGLSAAQFLPWLLFGVLAGALLDRIDRRKAVVVANSVRAAVVGLVALLVHLDATSIWLVYVAALLVGTAETVADSATNVLIPAVVERGGLAGANSKLQAAEIVGQTFLGGPVGSLTFALFAAFPFAIDSVAFALGAVLLAVLPGSYRPERGQGESTASTAPTASVRADIVHGLRWVRHHPVVARLVLVAGLTALISEMAQAQLVLYALDDLGLSEAAFGVFGFAGGIGGLLGAAVASRLLDRLGDTSTLLIGLVGCGATFLAMGLVTDPIVAGVLFALFAAAIVVVNVLLATARHTLVPEELLGRVLGVWRTVVWGSLPIGALLGGLTTRWLGTAGATFVLSGAGMLVVAVIAWVSVRDRELTPTRHS
ncbi:MFS transporter [Saccharomonospora azurea]|uniref:MFS transporter n=1 Tax=Saccharomonospora azurea TaxID=40988 RepID=UPI00023FEDCE|nr:MFS transporter [Saccharomonospora azurea]EHK84190.1 Major Facilitator Superfamily transporter [Saccharomonospora azurea SZMC 14600]